MRNGKCSKCGSATVYTQANGVVGHSREYISLDSVNYPVNVVTFLCGSCGYYENYISDVKKLGEAVQKWPKAPVA
jgi:hypothetical protein